MKKNITLSSMVLALGLYHSPSYAQIQNAQTSDESSFIGLTFHDVRDDVLKQGDKDVYAVSTQNLVQFFEWIKESPWRPISLQEIAEAKKNGTPLPENAVVISFDDGALSGYTHVYPLVQQYKIPVVFAIVTSWTNGNT
ncbi:MAG: polysaccharide deacetylase family protein, partial [Candidatus Acinetobacter avistercoris]|nr:polysaccharide deacetylase family protein [Candidatus Acinetobacter avistercoris]